MKDIGSLLGAIQPPYYEIDYTGLSYSIYDIIKQVLIAASLGLYALGGEDDSIIDTLQPDFVVNTVGFEDAATVIYRLLNMTKTFCRVETENTETSSGPNSVATGITEDSATFSLYARKTFYAVGRYWAFWFDGTNLVFSSSTDGSSWDSPTTIDTATVGHWAITYDTTNNKVAYVRAIQGATDYVYWRQGEPQTGGTITWDAVEQTVKTLVGTLLNPNCCFDTTGHAWVTWADGGTKPYVSKNANTDGTWSDATNFPRELTASVRNYTAPLPLLNGDVYVVTVEYNPPTYNLKGYFWNGSWGSEETIGTGVIPSANGWSAVAIGNTVHFAYRETTASPDNIVHRVRATDGTWSGTTVFSADDDIFPQLCNVMGVLYMFWDSYPTNQHVYFRKYDGTWDSTDTDQWTDSDAGGIRVQRMTAPYELHNGQIAVTWMTNTVSPYKIRIGIMTIHNASFRIKYPGGYSSYDYTYTSDQTNGDHQFKEFEWRDGIRIPNKVYVIANQSADETWDNYKVGLSELSIADNSLYPQIVEYYVASTITDQDDADNRAAAIALRRRLEEQLGRVVVPHNCGQELYDWIKIRDKRPTGSYVDYPPTRWGKEAIVGSLTHIFDPANGVYNLEITINGIESSAPMDATIPTLSRMLEDIGDVQIDVEGMKETIRAFSPPEDLAANLEKFATGMEELRHRVEVGQISPERQITYQEWAQRFDQPKHLFTETKDWAEHTKIMKRYYDWTWGL